MWWWHVNFGSCAGHCQQRTRTPKMRASNKLGKRKLSPLLWAACRYQTGVVSLFGIEGQRLGFISWFGISCLVSTMYGQRPKKIFTDIFHPARKIDFQHFEKNVCGPRSGKFDSFTPYCVGKIEFLDSIYTFRSGFSGLVWYLLFGIDGQRLKANLRFGIPVWYLASEYEKIDFRFRISVWYLHPPPYGFFSRQRINFSIQINRLQPNPLKFENDSPRKLHNDVRTLWTP